MFGGEPGPGDDLYALLGKADPASLPELYVSLRHRGLPLRRQRHLVDALRARGLDPVVDFRPGEHEWGFWDTDIQTRAGLAAPQLISRTGIGRPEAACASGLARKSSSGAG